MRWVRNPSMPSKLCLGLIGAAALLLGAEASASEAAGPNIDSIVQTVRSQIELYRVQHDDELPWAPGEVAQKQWTPLVDEDYLQAAPRNPCVSEEVATTIVELTEPGDIGANIDRATAGWAWNSTDEMLYAIGVEEWEIAQAWEKWELAREREDLIRLLLKVFAGESVLEALLYAARPFVRRVVGKEA